MFVFSEISCDIVFMPSAEVNPLLAGLLYPKIEADYPIISKRDDLGYQVKSLTDNRKRDVISEPLTVFKNDENTRFVQVSESILAINSVIDSDWSNFEVVVAGLLENINNILGVERLIRHIHIRRIYSAVIDDLKEVTNNGIKVVEPSFLESSKLLSFRTNSEYEVAHESIFGVNVMSVFPDDPKKEQALLDFSVLNNVPERVNINNFKQWFIDSQATIDQAVQEIVKI